MADLCACQRPGIEAAIKVAHDTATDFREHGGGKLSPNANGAGVAALAIRALLETPTSNCPRCEMVAAAERVADDPNPFHLDALLRAIERMGS